MSLLIRHWIYFTHSLQSRLNWRCSGTLQRTRNYCSQFYLFLSFLTLSL